MIIVLKPNTAKAEIETISTLIKEKNLEPLVFEGIERTVIHVLGNIRDDTLIDAWQSRNSVEKVLRILKPYKLASNEHKSKKTVISVGDVTIGNGGFTVIAGPCAVENKAQVAEAARLLRGMGLRIMRASAFKPRTSPYAFQGLGQEGLEILKEVRDEFGIFVETEVMNVRDVELVAEYADIVRIGARNMANFDLLKEAGNISKPVILKRGMAATIKEFIMAAEYILYNGNQNVILCERGIRTFETAYRNTLDIAAVDILKRETHLPVIVDPSHSAGNRDLVPALSKAAIAVGADGLLVEMHPDPEKALSDGPQSLYPRQLEQLLVELRQIGAVVGKTL